MKNNLNLPAAIHNEVQEIITDNTSGSVELTIKAARLLQQIGNKTYNTSADLNKTITQVGIELITGHPTMASLFTLVNTTLLNIQNKNHVDEIKATLHDTSTEFLTHLDTAVNQISRHATDLIPDDTTILVHSYSSTVFHALIHAQQNRKKIMVICTESRPMNEGKILAHRLGKAGIHTSLIVDTAVSSFLPDIDLFCVGADAIINKSAVNKIGTYLYAIAAKQHTIRCYTLCSTDKILPNNYTYRHRYPENPNEITNEQIDNVTPLNFYFEKTPLNLFTGIITEIGVLNPQDILNNSTQLTVHPTLEQIQ